MRGDQEKAQKFIDDLQRRMEAPDEESRQSNGHAGHSTSTLTDDEVIERCRRAKSSARFSDLFDDGEKSAYDDDDSDADYALIGFLKRHTRHPIQIERIMLRSALRRPKWDEDRVGKTWLRYSIENALDGETSFSSFHSPIGGADDDENNESEIEGNVYLHHTQMGFGANKPDDDKPLPIKTIEEVIEEAGEEVPWLIEDLLARGAVTEFSGKAKDSGKTTFWCHAVAAGAREEDHAGFMTSPAKYLYLTEQGNNFALALRDSGLTEHPDHVRIVQFKDVTALQWDRLVRKAAKEVDQLGMDALIVDTFAVFARLKGSEENDSGPVADRMRVLREVAQKYDIGVLLIRHAGKDGTPRGSSAFEAEADICITLGKPEGNHAPTVRALSGKGRYGVWERNVQLHEGRFISLGTDAKVEFNRAVRFLRTILPKEESEGMRRQAILEARVGADAEQITATTLDRALTWLVKQEAVLKKKLEDQRGQPVVFWLNPHEKGRGVYLHQTSSPNGTNKKETKDPAQITSVSELFTNPPSWLPRQLEVYHDNPERHFKPLCKAVAAMVLGNDADWEEVKADVLREVGPKTRRVHIPTERKVGRPYEPPDIVYAGHAFKRRPYNFKESKWANPHYKLKDVDREKCLALYREHILNTPELLSCLEELRGKTIGCFCPLDQECHVDILIELLECDH